MKHFIFIIIILNFSLAVQSQSITTGGPTTICGTGNVLLSVSGAASGATFQWQNNSISIAGQTAISFNATSSGNYGVIITSTNPPDTLAAINVSITTPPVADFNFDATAATCADIPINFTSIISSGIAPFTYNWNFGDGTSSAGANPSHALSSVGCGFATLAATLTVTDAKGCTSTVTKNITIKQAPDVQLSDLLTPGTPFSNCANDPSPTNPNYTISVGNASPSAACISAYSIDWGDGNIENAISFPANHTYTSLGVFNMLVTAAGTNGCNHTKSYVVANQKNPDIGIGTFGLTEGCAPVPVNIVISAWPSNSPGTTYSLNFGDGKDTFFTHPINPRYTNDTLVHNYTTTSCPNLPVFNITISATNACRSKTFVGGDIVVKIKPQSDFIILTSPSCAGKQVCFNNTTKSGFDVNCSIYGATKWNFGDPASGANDSSALNSPCHTYANPGVYTVTLTTLNICGPSTITHTVCVTPKPLTGFTIDQTTGCSPLAVSTTNTTNSFNACANPTYKWRVDYAAGFCGTTSAFSFTNNTTDSSSNPSFSFVNPGTYTLVLLVTSPCGVDSLKQIIVVKQPPQVTINSITNICANGSINPTAIVASCTPLTNLQYSWVFTDGSPAISNAIVPGNIVYSTLGIHPIQLSVTNECGTTTPPSVQVNVIAAPVANAGADKIICSRASASIGTAGIPGVNYQWTPTIGLSSINTDITSVTLTYTGSGADTVYTYVVTASAGANCSSTDTVLVTVNKRPVVVLNPLNPIICAGSSIQLTASGAAQYNWIPAGGLNNSNTDTVIATLNNTATYQVTGTNINTCSDTASITVTVLAYPITNAGKDSTVCNNSSSVQFNGLPAGGLWSGNNITPGGLYNPQAAGNGQQTLYYSATNSTCSKTDSLVVTVISPPLVNAGKDTTLCRNDSIVSFTGNPAGGSWSGTSLITPAGKFTPSTTGSFQLIYTFSAGSCSTSDTLIATVGAGISNNTISPNQAICINTQPSLINGLPATGGGGSTAYQWQSGTDSLTWTNIPGETGLNYLPPVLNNTTFYRRIAFTTLCAGTQGSFSAPVKITINQNTKANFIANPLLGCAPFNVASVITVTTYPDRNGLYQWFANAVPIGSNSTGIFPGYILGAANDSVLIKLITTSPFGCKSDSIQQQFNTRLTAQAKFIKDTSGGCGPVTVNFTNTTGIITGTQFNWNFGNGATSNIAQPLPVIFTSSPFNSDTTYQVTLKAFNGCDTTIWRDSIRIRANPKARFGVDTTYGCSPFTVHIDNTSLGAPNTYYWNFGNGHIDTTYTTGPRTYTYNSGPGVDTFSIQLIAVNECKRDTQTINIRVAPNAIVANINLNSTDLFGCAPHNIAINNNSSGATTFTWYFGDGSPVLVTNASQSIVPHAYTDTGSFTIKVIISNGCSDTTVYRAVTVYKKPTALFTTNKNIYCQGDEVAVTNTSINATNYQWFWGDGTSNTGLNPSHIYTAPGNYTIYLRAEKTNNSGLVCYDTLVKPVTILGKPIVSVASNINGLNCAPFTLQVTAPGIINENTNWYFFDSTANPAITIKNGVTATYTYTKPGNFYVKLLAKNIAGCSDSTIIPFTVQGMPVAAFTPTNLSVCTTDTTIAYLNTTSYNGIDAIRYNWQVDNVSLSANGNFTHRYTASPVTVLPQTFTTSLIVSNAFGCSDTARAILQMNPAAKAQFTIGNTLICVPFMPIVNNTSPYTTNYKWLLNGQLVSTAANPDIVISKGGTLYNLTLIANNNYGCKPDTLSVTFTSRIKPVAGFTVSDTLGCTGILNVGTINNTTNANKYNWDWGDNSPVNNFINPSHNYNNTGEYQITLVATDGVCSDTASQLVKVSNKPLVDFTANTTLTCDTARVQFINLTSNGNNYSWSFGDGTFSADINPSKSFAPSAVPYTVKLVAYSSLGCKDSAVKANLIMAKVPPAADFFISPTPVITVPAYTFSFNNLTQNQQNYQYQWSLGDGSSAITRDVLNHKYADTGTYPIRLIVFDNLTNCADTTTKLARIGGFPGWMYIPNAICPNCLQENLRTFLPKAVGLKEYHLQIFTTWGELVFESTSLDGKGSPNQPWNATYLKGGGVIQDAYVWKIQAKYINGSEWLGMIYPGETRYKKAGSITVVK